jgi:nitrite reductase (NADH) large subunit
MKSNERKELVVIGNGMAGVATVEEILKLDPDKFNISIFGKEVQPNYNRVLLGDLLTEEKSVDEITLNSLEWYEENSIRLFAACPAVKIDRLKRTVVSADGRETPYDTLILALGSKPMLPPIPGMEKDGVLSFREISDCTEIRKRTKKGKKATVIGGGLLGLEAARALKTLGMDVSVVHLTDKLMERQLDTIAANYLAEDLEAQGINILLEKETVEITGNGKVEGLRFKDGEEVDAEMVVMAIGITPNKELAETSGIYCERGIVVSDTMQTYDPAIYAVGECVQNRGATFGLVAQVFDHGRVLGNHLAGDARLAFKNRPVSMRLKVPGIDLYSGGRVEEGAGVETIEYKDDGARSYKKLYLKDNRIKGVLLYGDIEDGPRLFQHLLDSDDVSERRRELLFGETRGNAAVSITSMPDETIVCGCNGVTKGNIVEAIKAKGLFSLEDVTKETKAGGSCGGCSDVVERILESVLGTNFESGAEDKSICACTKYTREDIIKNIREKELRSVGAVMETLGWETVGCEECRPAINYYVSMVWPLESTDDPTSRLINERTHANQQKDGTFSVVPRIYGGVTTPNDLKKIAETAIKNKVPLVKITGGQRIDLLGIEQERLAEIWKELDMPSGFAYAKAVRTVKTCVGEKFCRFGTQDSMALGIELEKLLEGLWMPAKVKLAVSGCPRNCAESSIKDVGIVGVKGGFNIYIGGNGGTNLRGADKLCTVETEAEVVVITGAFLQLYREEAEYAERSSKWVERVGLKTIKKAIIEDKGKRERLNARLKIALTTVKEPWGERVSKTSTDEASSRQAL